MGIRTREQYRGTDITGGVGYVTGSARCLVRWVRQDCVHGRVKKKADPSRTFGLSWDFVVLAIFRSRRGSGICILMTHRSM